MPYLKIKTNNSVNNKKELLGKASKLVADQLGKSEKYVMVALEPESEMSFGGSFDPVAFIQLKSIGLPAVKTKQISSAICDFVNKELDIPSERIYIEFTDVQRFFWGWNGGTF